MRKKYIYFIFPFLCFLTAMCKAKIQGDDLAVGIAVINAQKLTVSTTQSIIKDKSIFICPLNDKKKSKCLNLSGERFYEIKNSEGVSDVIYGGVIHEFNTDGSLLIDADFSVGMVLLYNAKLYPSINFINAKEGASILVDIKKERLTINSCNGSEGVHVYSSNLNEHLYYPFGYNVTETCSKEVYH